MGYTLMHRRWPTGLFPTEKILGLDEKILVQVISGMVSGPTYETKEEAEAAKEELEKQGNVAFIRGPEERMYRALAILERASSVLVLLDRLQKELTHGELLAILEE